MVKAKASAYIVVSSLVALFIMLPLIPQVLAGELKHTTLKVEGWL